MRPTDSPSITRFAPILARRIEHWPIDRLTPYDRNARTHSEFQITQIAASIREFGFANPILVDGQNGIIAGHARLLAARELGLSEVPVVVLDHLSETQRRAYVLADNRLALSAGWDNDLLKAELAALSQEEFDLALLGFEDEELAELLKADESALVDEDSIPEVGEQAVSRAGDLWRLGPHRLLCEDATEARSIEQVLSGGLADMVFTDPPYNVAYQSSGKKAHKKIANDDLGATFGVFLERACTNVLAVTKGAVYICMSSGELHTLQSAFLRAGGHWSTFVIWAKNTFTLGRSDYQRQYEPILYGWREATDHFWCGARDQGDVWFVNKPASSPLHPTTKPVELMERAIRNSSKGRDTVLDCFAGSGSTLIACEKTGRQARLIELEPLYVDVIVRRWQEFTGKRATQHGTSRTFDEVRQQRASAANGGGPPSTNPAAQTEGADV